MIEQVTDAQDDRDDDQRQGRAVHSSGNLTMKINFHSGKAVWLNTEKRTAAAPPSEASAAALRRTQRGCNLGLLFGHAEQGFTGGFRYARKCHFFLDAGQCCFSRFSN